MEKRFEDFDEEKLKETLEEEFEKGEWTPLQGKKKKETRIFAKARGGKF